MAIWTNNGLICFWEKPKTLIVHGFWTLGPWEPVFMDLNIKVYLTKSEKPRNRFSNIVCSKLGTLEFWTFSNRESKFLVHLEVDIAQFKTWDFHFLKMLAFWNLGVWDLGISKVGNVRILNCWSFENVTFWDVWKFETLEFEMLETKKMKTRRNEETKKWLFEY